MYPATLFFFFPFLLLLPQTFASTPSLRICAQTLPLPHTSTISPTVPSVPVTIPLRLRYLCSRRNRPVGVDKPLLIFLPAALTRPRDYSRILTGLARRGFVVAYPDYTERNFRRASPLARPFYQLVDQTRAAGHKCPRNGQIPSASLVNSVLTFLATANLSPAIRRSFSMEKTVLFGHDLGGHVLEQILGDTCNIDDPQTTDPALLFAKRVLCEEYEPLQMPDVKIMGYVTYNGITDPSTFKLSNEQFFLEIHSEAESALVDELLSSTSFEKRLVSVELGMANGYGPNNFVSESDNQTPVCAEPSEAEDGFRTTRDDQNRVIKTISRLSFAAYKAHENRKGLAALGRFVKRKDFVVNKVTVY